MSELRAYRVDGMSCEGCVRAVTNAVRKVRPEAFVQVDLPSGTVTVGGVVGDDAIRGAIEQAGFEFKGAV